MVKISKETHVKAKKGQILIFALISMAVGLIVIAPLLHYIDSSYNLYSNKLKGTMAYYTADAMLEKIFSDMYAGQDVYYNSSSYTNQSWLNGYSINTSINDSIASSPPGAAADWIYMDPGCGLGLNSLASGATYNFNVYLTEGTTVKANWYFKDAKAGNCNYYCIGNMSITYQNGSTVKYTNGSAVTTGTKMNGVNTAFQQNLSWTVPQGGSGNYFIQFKNNAVRGQGGSCGNVTRSMSDMLVAPTFSGIGDPTYTWVSIGNSSGGQVLQYQDYTITTTASLHNAKIASITVCVRQTPGPLIWWQHQSLAVVSWTVKYY